jgi:NitT/TauT family transport system ATP-binding protein
VTAPLKNEIAVRGGPAEGIDNAGDYAVQIEEKRFTQSAAGDILVLKDLSFALPPGSFTCLIGPSGCGKTTTLRIMLGLDQDFRGRISPSLVDERMAPVFQEPRLLPWRTVEENIRLALPPRLADKDLSPILDAVELRAFRHSYPGELSLGMARRAALARAFSVEPTVLLLDEPFVSLDESTADRLRALLLDLWRSTRVTVLMVTHNVREAVLLAERLIILSPRPAHVLATADVQLPYERRRGLALDNTLKDLAQRFPSLSFM